MSLHNKRRIPKRIVALICAVAVVLVTIFSVTVVPKIVKEIKKDNEPVSETEETTTHEVSSTDKYNALVNEYQDAFDKKDYETALSCINDCIELQPSEITLYEARAQLYYLLNDYENSLSDYLYLVSQDSQNSDYLLGCLNLYTEMNDSDKAIETALKLNDIVPDNKDYLTILGDLYAGKGDYTTSCEYYEKAKALSTGNDEYILSTSIYKMKGNLCNNINDYNGAYTNYNEYIKLVNDYKSKNDYKYTDDDMDILCNLGLCAIQLDKYDEAKNAFSDLIALNYKPELCYFQRGLCNYSTQNYEDAISDLSIYEGYAPDSTDQYIYIALSAFSIEDYSKSATYFNKCLDANIYIGDANYFIGIIDLQNEDNDAAVKCLSIAKDYDNYRTSSIYNRGVAYVRLKKYDLATTDFQTIVDENNDETLTASAEDVLKQLKDTTQNNQNIVIQGNNATIINGVLQDK